MEIKKGAPKSAFLAEFSNFFSLQMRMGMMM
jgi:hypothetical protein